jgi:hypothetical protein
MKQKYDLRIGLSSEYEKFTIIKSERFSADDWPYFIEQCLAIVLGWGMEVEI